jgi:acyl-CoA thioester hydrolase
MKKERIMTHRRIINYFPPEQKAPLVAECFRRVQFNEVDSCKIVWHGCYLSYFEQGRNEWGRKFGFSYRDMNENGFAMPIIQQFVDHLYPLHHDELIRIKTNCHWTAAAKMNISYEIFAENGVLAARGYTVQLYTDLNGKPMLLRPDFVERFYQRWDEYDANQNAVCSLYNN